MAITTKGKVKNGYVDFETTTDLKISDYVAKFDNNNNKITKSMLNEFFAGNDFKAPQIYLVTFCYDAQYGNIVETTQPTFCADELKEALKKTNQFNIEFVQHCSSKKCQFSSLDHYRLSFYNKNHFLLFFMNYCLSWNIWAHNGSKFDWWFLKGLLESNGYKPFIEYSFIDHLDNIMKVNPLNTLEKFDLQKNHQLWINNFRRVEKLYEQALINSKKKLVKKNLWIKKNWNLDFDFNKTYRIAIDGNNRILKLLVYSDEKYITTKKNEKCIVNKTINFKDNILLFTTSIASMGKDLAKYFGNKGMKDSKYWFLKKDIPNQHQQENCYSNNDEMLRDYNGKVLEYGYTDTFIIYGWHKMLDYEGIIKRKDWKLTAAATAYEEFKRMVGYYFLENYEHEYKTVVLNNNFVKYQYRDEEKLLSVAGIGGAYIRDLLPTKWISKEFHKDIRRWYFGGLTSVNEQYRGMFLQNLIYIDINSSYSKSMHSDELCPTGIGYQGDRKGYDYKLIELQIKKTIRNRKGLPFVTDASNKFVKQNAEKNAQYLSTLQNGMIIHLDSNEYKRFKIYYSNKVGIDYDLYVKWSFKASTFNKIFGMYIDKYYRIKQESSRTGNLGAKIFAKLLLNALYGKFATKFMKETSFIPYKTRAVKYEIENIKKYYLPMGIAITANARMQLVDACKFNYEHWVYNDTDSAFIINKEFNKKFSHIELDNEKLGAWKIEKTNLTGIIRRPKQYFTFSMDDYELKAAFAGYKINPLYSDDEFEEIDITTQNDRIQVKLKEIITGRLFNNQIGKATFGHFVQLYGYPKKLKPVWEFTKLYEQFRYLPQHFKKDLKEIKKFEDEFYKKHNKSIYDFIIKRNKITKNFSSEPKVPCY